MKHLLLTVVSLLVAGHFSTGLAQSLPSNSDSDCTKACKTIVEIAIPAKERAEAEKKSPEVVREALNECVVECRKLPKAMQTCWGKAHTKGDFETCEKLAGDGGTAPVAEPMDSPAAVVPDRLPTTASATVLIPSCETVCNHILDMALVEVPAGQREAARKDASSVLDKCYGDCKAELDDATRLCFYRANTMEEGEACEAKGANQK